MSKTTREQGLDDARTFTRSLDGTDAQSGDKESASPASDAGAAAPAHDWIGKRLSHFKLLRLLGEGGMGMVVQALDVNLDRIVALKILRKRIEGVDEKQRVRQFLREAKAAAKIDHPNVARIYEINEHRGWWYIASEMLEGGTMDRVVQAMGKLPPAAACPLIADAASALAVAHQVGIIHRDIKPQNLMLTRDGHCKLVDFGLVRIEDPNDPFDFSERVFGTPQYIPPEAAARLRPAAAYDIYSLGATLYFALTGEPPFDHEDLKALVRMHRDAPRPDVRARNPDCSEHLADLIQRCLAVDPEARPDAQQVASELRLESIGSSADLASLANVPGVLSTPTGAQPETGMKGFTGALSATRAQTAGTRKPRRLGRLAAVAALIAAAAGLGVWWYLAAPKECRDRAAFAECFPDAPASYGQGGDEAPPERGRVVPPFSWKGQIDAGTAQYAGTRTGHRAFPVGSDDAALIPADEVVFFADEAAARDAGRRIGR